LTILELLYKILCSIKLKGDEEMKIAVVDYRTSEEEVSTLKDLGFIVLFCPPCLELYPAVMGHPDMQINYIGNDKIIFQRNIDINFIKTFMQLGFNVLLSENKLTKTYPQDIILNSVLMGDIFLHKLNCSDPVLLEHVKSKKLINVKQGYTKCSTAIVSDFAAITSDKGIAEALSKEGIDVLILPPGDIELPGLDYGFIGGACGLISSGHMGFFGELHHYIYGNEVLSFLKKHKVVPIYLKKGKLLDRGTLLTFTK
jgi:hypothetical protein